jgi:aspartate/methionine/tyrosine aminotransferase
MEAMNEPPVGVAKRWRAAYTEGPLCETQPLIDMSQAAPGYTPHPKILQALEDAGGDVSNLGYGPGQGEVAFTEAYALHCSTHVYTHTHPTSPDELATDTILPSDVHITSGCNQAFTAVALSVADTQRAGSSDELLLTSPLYFNHATTLDMLGIAYRCVDGITPSASAIEASITANTRAVVLTTPNNPTGFQSSPSFLEEVFL